MEHMYLSLDIYIIDRFFINQSIQSILFIQFKCLNILFQFYFNHELATDTWYIFNE